MGKLELKHVKLGEHGKLFPVDKESEITWHSKYDLYCYPLVTMDSTRRQLTHLKPGKEREEHPCIIAPVPARRAA
jgi:hypothetical protein